MEWEMLFPLCKTCIIERMILVFISSFLIFLTYKRCIREITPSKIKYLFAVLWVVLTLGFLFTTPTYLAVKHPEYLYGCEKNVEKPKNLEGLADKLAAKGWVLFYSSYCGACRKQVEVFGEDFYKLNSINVLYVPPPNWLRAVPTWWNPRLNVTVVGYQSREQLEKMLELG